MQALFISSNACVLPFWLLMLFAPRAALTRRVLESPWICAPFALLYAALFVSQLGPLTAFARAPSFESIVGMIGTPAGLNLAWAHYLTFDLFVGRWIYFDSEGRTMNRGLMTVVFLLGLTFGPLGFLVYLLSRGHAPAQAVP
jgi:hypothetical protein